MRKFLILFFLSYYKIKYFFKKISKICIHDWKKVIATNRLGKPICATIICVKCKKTIIK